MRFELRTVLFGVIAACSSACSPSEPQRSEPAGQDVAASQAGERSDEPASDEPEPDEILTPDDEVIEIAGPEDKRDRNTVPVKPITLTDASVSWTERERIADPELALLVVASGVVARSPRGVYTLADDHLTLQAGLTLPEAPLLGHWPGDVWYVEATPSEPDEDGRPRFDHRLFRLDRELAWAEQTRKREQPWPGSAIRKGWLAGILVREGSSLTRVGSRKDAPKVGVRMGKIVLDVVETASGRLYNVSLRTNGVYVQQACFTRSCTEESAKKLPFGSDWSFGAQVPRQRNSFSMLATVNVDGAVSQQLLHYETGGWSLETLVHEPSGMWPSGDGGLWLLVRDELRYRTPQGHWYAIAAPEGASKLSVAVDEKLATLWIAAKIGAETVLFTTAASPAELPAPPE